MTNGLATPCPHRDTSPEPHNMPQQSFPVRPLRTWIMVADNNTARIFARNENIIDPVGKIIRTRPEIRTVTIANGAGTKKIAHYYRHRHPYTKRAEQESLSFAHKISAWLDEAIWNDAFDRMLLMTPRPLQAALYNTFSPPALARIAAVINKDFSGESTETIRKELTRLIAN